jgi:RNA polymerase sigma-70 factor, ECF subfamily
LDWIGARVDQGPPPDHRVLGEERTDELLTALRTLPAREREVLAMKFAGGLTNRAIAQVIGLTENHVAVVVYRAVGRLRDRLGKEHHHE